MLLKYEQIRMDGGTQPRSQLLISIMEEYAELMRGGTKFPPVVVFFDGHDYWLADGFHRMGAALRARPDQPIEAEVIQGTQAEAQWYSFGVNKTHGLRRTNEDKERAVRAALAHPKSQGFSDSNIAEHVGVHRNTVLKIRRESATKQSDLHKMCKSNSPAGQPGLLKTDKSASRKGRDGRTINTANIGKKAKSRKAGVGGKFSRDAFKPVLGHSLPNPMISLSLPPHNPVIAAATICNLFEPTFIKTLIEELTQRMKGLSS